MNKKDVIYVDVEDEITNIIDKVNTSKSKVVALVLPKRATVFQSVVNMKLLKKKASDAKKNVILVTSEAGLLPLAGAVGVFVAKSLQAKPEIPPNPNLDSLDEGPINLEGDDEEQPPLDSKKSIGELAGLAAVGAVAAKSNEPDDNISIDNDAISDDPMGLSDIDKDAAAKTKKDKKSKKAKGLNGKPTSVPDFNKFRKRLLIGGAILLALILFWIIGFKVLPKATIIVQTNTSGVNSNLTLNLSQADQNVIVSSGTVPAKFQTVIKTSTSSAVNTTGTKAVGTSATGSVSINNPCDPINGSTQSVTVPSGTHFTDGSGNVYTSSSSVTVPGYSTSHGKCSPGNGNVNVTAAGIGSNYNNSSNSTKYTSDDGDISTFDITGGPMAGGSSSTVQVVAAADVASAQNQLTSLTSSQVKQQLETSLKGEGYMPVTTTYVSGTPSYVPSAAVGAQANSVTVTESVTYSMYGVKQSDLNTVILANVNQQINPKTQSILASNAANATFALQSTGSATDVVTMQATSTVGPKVNATTIQTQSAGQKSGDIKSTINQIPGVTNVTIKYSPFWVTATPNNAKKITVIIEKANGSQP